MPTPVFIFLLSTLTSYVIFTTPVYEIKIFFVGNKEIKYKPQSIMKNYKILLAIKEQPGEGNGPKRGPLIDGNK